MHRFNKQQQLTYVNSDSNLKDNGVQPLLPQIRFYNLLEDISRFHTIGTAFKLNNKEEPFKELREIPNFG